MYFVSRQKTEDRWALVAHNQETGTYTAIMSFSNPNDAYAALQSLVELNRAAEAGEVAKVSLHNPYAQDKK